MVNSKRYTGIDWYRNILFCWSNRYSFLHEIDSLGYDILFRHNFFMLLSATYYDLHYFCHCFQNRTGPGGRTVKTGNRDENRFFKPKEPDFLLIPWTVKTGVGLLEPVRTVQSNPLAIFFFFKNNLTQFYFT